MGMGYGMVQENNKLFDENCVGEEMLVVLQEEHSQWISPVRV